MASHAGTAHWAWSPHLTPPRGPCRQGMLAGWCLREKQETEQGLRKGSKGGGEVGGPPSHATAEWKRDTRFDGKPEALLPCNYP